MIRRVDVRYAAAAIFKPSSAEAPRLAWAFCVDFGDGRPPFELAGAFRGPLGYPLGTCAEIAAYTAVTSALENLIFFGLAHAQTRFYGDGLALVNRMNGRWKVKIAALEVPHLEAAGLSGKFTDIYFTWASSKENARAEELASRALAEPNIQEETKQNG